MSGLVLRSIGPVGDDLVVLDSARRLYAGLSRDVAYWHVVHPAPADMVNADNAVIRREGELTCTCKGGLFRGTCYRVEQGEAFEAGKGIGAFVDSPAGAGEAVEAFRG